MWCDTWTQTLHHGTVSWRVIHHPEPLEQTRYHLLLIPLRHVQDLLDLPPVAQDELWQVMAWAREEFGLYAYGFASRNGLGTGHAYAEMILGDTASEGYDKTVVTFR